MEEKTQENEARNNLLECLDDNADIDLYLSGMDKSKLKIDQTQAKTNQEIGSWDSDGQMNILSSLGEYNRQRNNNSSQISKGSVDSKTQLSSRFLQNNRRQIQGQGSNLQTVYSSLTNNSNVIRNSISPTAEDRMNNIKNVSTISNQEQLESSHTKGFASKNEFQSQNTMDDQKQQEEMQSSWVFMSPNYIEHRKQLQVGMLMDRHTIKNGRVKSGQKTIESVTFNDKQIMSEINQDFTGQQLGISGGGLQKKEQDNKQKYKAVQCREYTLNTPTNKNKDQKKPNLIKSEDNNQEIFRQLNYYDVLDMKGQDSLDTLHIKNDIKKYKNLRPGTYIGIMPKKDVFLEKNQLSHRTNQLSTTLDLSNLKLLQNTTTPFQASRAWRKKQQSTSEERSLTERNKEVDLLNNPQKSEQGQSGNSKEILGINIGTIKNQKQQSNDRIFSQTSRNSLNLNETVDFQEKFREQASLNSNSDTYSPLKPKFTLNSNQQKPIQQTRRVSIKGGGGFYYLKDEMIQKIERDDEFLQQYNVQNEYNVQTHPIQQFIDYEKKKEIVQMQKMHQKEIEINQIQYEMNQKEMNYSPTQVVNKYTILMKEDPNFKKNIFYVNKKLNKLERKKTIEEFRTRSTSPLAQIIEAVNQNPLFKQSTTFYNPSNQKNTQQLSRSSQSPQTIKKLKQKGFPELVNEQQTQFHQQQQPPPLGATNYTKYRKWKGSPLFNLENNDLNRNPYINSGFSPLIAQQPLLQHQTKSRNSSKKQNNRNHSLNTSIQTLYNPQPQLLLDQSKKFKMPTSSVN